MDDDVTPWEAQVEAWRTQTDAWQKLAAEATRAWSPSAPPVARGVAAGIASSQAAIARWVETVGAAWQASADQAADGRSWAEAVDATVAQLRRAWSPDPEAWTAAGQDTAEAWRLYIAAMQRIVAPLGASLDEAHGHIGSAMAGDRSAFQELTRLYWDAWEHTGGRLFERPSFGLTREFEEKLLRGFDAWIDHRRAVLDYQAVVAGASAEAVGAILRAMSERSRAGQPIASLRELTTVWTTLTDETMERVFRSEPYAAAQGRMLNAAMVLRQHERAIAEALLKMTDIPARSEVDEAFKEIHALRREVKSLRREMAALRQGAKSTARSRVKGAP